MEQFPRFQSKRLILDQIRPSDISDIVACAGNIMIAENTRSIPHPYQEEDAISWIHMANTGFKAKDNYMFTMRFRDNLAFIGGIGLTIDKENNRAELGYWLTESFWNMGLTTEAVRAILKFGFEELKLNKILAIYLASNEASGRVMINNGMVKEAEFKDHDVKRGHSAKDNIFVSLIQYRMTKSEYKSL